MRHPQERLSFVTNTGIFVGTYPIARASNLHSAIDLVIPTKRFATVHSCESVNAGTYIRGNAATTICTRVDAFTSHDRSLDPAAGVISISNIIGVVDANVSTGPNGKAIFVDSRPIVMIVVALLPFPPIAKKTIRCGGGLPVAIAKFGPGVGPSGIVVRKVVTEAALSARIVISSAQLRISVVVQKGERHISSQCKFEGIDLIISARHVVVRHVKMASSTAKAVESIGKVFSVINLKAASGVDRVVATARLEATPVVRGHHLVVRWTSCSVAFETAVLAPAAKFN